MIPFSTKFFISNFFESETATVLKRSLQSIHLAATHIQLFRHFGRTNKALFFLALVAKHYTLCRHRSLLAYVFRTILIHWDANVFFLLFTHSLFTPQNTLVEIIDPHRFWWLLYIIVCVLVLKACLNLSRTYRMMIKVWLNRERCFV